MVGVVPAVNEGRNMASTGVSPTGWQRFLTRMRRAVRAFESERTEDTSSWTFQVRLERDDLDGGWIAECLDLPGCMSQGETRDEAVHNLIDAISEVVAFRMGEHVPSLIDDDEHAGREVSLSL